jgi:hypothetical protein
MDTPSFIRQPGNRISSKVGLPGERPRLFHANSWDGLLNALVKPSESGPAILIPRASPGSGGRIFGWYVAFP